MSNQDEESIIMLRKFRDKLGYSNYWTFKQAFLDKYGPIIVIISVIASIILICWLLGSWFSSVTCHRFGIITGFPVKYDIRSMICFSQYHDIWLPADQIFQLIGK